MILFDTCTLLWLGADPAKLSAKAREIIESNSESLFVSSISAFEIAIKHKRKRLAMPMDPAKWFVLALDHLGIHEIEVNAEIFAQSVSLPDLHHDPCDRVIAATAKLHGLTCLTPDALIRQYPGVAVEW